MHDHHTHAPPTTQTAQALQRLAVQRHALQREGVPEEEEEPLQALQRSAGNAAVAAELQREPGSASPVLGVVGRGGGRPLDGAVRTDMEGRFGADFGHVRVHDDPVAQRSATAVGARAYTSGHEVVLGEGVALGSDDGRHTLAHELTHVLQQGRGPVSGTPTGDGVSVSDPGDSFEQEAEATAHAVLSATPEAAPVAQRETEPQALQALPIQREEFDEDEPA